MRRVVVQVTVSVPDTAPLDSWCCLVRESVRLGIVSCGHDAEDVRRLADPLSIDAFVVRTYESIAIPTRAKHHMVRGKKRDRDNDDK